MFKVTLFAQLRQPEDKNFAVHVTGADNLIMSATVAFEFAATAFTETEPPVQLIATKRRTCWCHRTVGARALDVATLQQVKSN
jgi:hypothetical protein